MVTRYIFNTSGEYVAFKSGDNLFDKECNWIGFIKNDNEVYNTKGKYVGYILDDDRVVRNTSNSLNKPGLLVPLRPLKPLKPLNPLKRLRMLKLPFPYIDVFQDKRTFNELFLGLYTDYSKFNSLLNARIVGNDGTFLGIISKDSYDLNSINNKYGNYGSRYSATSIFNEYGNYGGQYSAMSPFNPYSNTPPKLYIDKSFAGYLTVNSYISNAINTNELVAWLES